MAQSPGEIRSVTLTTDRVDRDGDIIDPAGMRVDENSLERIEAAQRGADFTRLFQDLEANERIEEAQRRAFLNGAMVAVDEIRGAYGLPPLTDAIVPLTAHVESFEHPDLLLLLQTLSQVPVIEFLEWRKQAGVVCDWLEEHSDGRAVKFRELINEPVGPGKIEFFDGGRLVIENAATHGRHFHTRFIVTGQWRHAAAQWCQKRRVEILVKSGLIRRDEDFARVLQAQREELYRGFGVPPQLLHQQRGEPVMPPVQHLVDYGIFDPGVRVTHGGQ